MMFATRDEALVMAARFLGSTDGVTSSFLLDEKGFWLAPKPDAELSQLQLELKTLRPRIAGWIRNGKEGDQQLFPTQGSPILFILIQIAEEPTLRALGLPLLTAGIQALDTTTDQLLSQVDGIAFCTDGMEARSQGQLGARQGSNWQPESWQEFWSRLLVAAPGSTSLFAQARKKSVRMPVYSIALCRFLEVTAGQAGAGIAGWFRLQQPQNQAIEEVARFFTYVGNPALVQPLGEQNPVTLALQIHLAADGRSAWIEYLHSLSQERVVDTSGFSTEFTSSQSFYALSLNSAAVIGPEGSVLGYHHTVALQPDPVLDAPAPLKTLAQDAYADALLLTKEANHRIKNSLSMAASLLQLQSYTLEDKAAKDALTDAVQRLYTVSDLHGALYKYTVGTEQVEMRPFLENVSDRLQKLIQGQGIEIRVQIEDIVLPNKKAGRIGFLINELVLNAAKYAFTESKQGFIAIYLTKSMDSYYLSVQDNGQGMEQRAIASDSLGSTLITEFAKDLNAEMRLETHAGTRYVFTFL
jgi:two-component sensor histidine kinase